MEEVFGWMKTLVLCPNPNLGLTATFRLPYDLPSRHADSTAKPGNEAENRLKTVRTIGYLNVAFKGIAIDFLLVLERLIPRHAHW